MEESHPKFLKKKLCTGPCHEEGGELVPIEEFYFHKSGLRKGQPVSRCRRCINYNKVTGKGKKIANQGETGLVSSQRYRWVFEEIIRRVGVEEAARLMQCSTSTLRAVRLMPHRLDRPPQKHIQKHTAVRALRVLRELRAENVVRHKSSIAHGAKKRNRNEKTPVNRRDFYVNYGDNEKEVKRQERKRKSDTI